MMREFARASPAPLADHRTAALARDDDFKRRSAEFAFDQRRSLKRVSRADPRAEAFCLGGDHRIGAVAQRRPHRAFRGPEVDPHAAAQREPVLLPRQPAPHRDRGGGHRRGSDPLVDSLVATGDAAALRARIARCTPREPITSRSSRSRPRVGTAISRPPGRSPRTGLDGIPGRPRILDNRLSAAGEASEDPAASAVRCSDDQARGAGRGGGLPAAGPQLAHLHRAAEHADRAGLAGRLGLPARLEADRPRPRRPGGDDLLRRRARPDRDPGGDGRGRGRRRGLGPAGHLPRHRVGRPGAAGARLLLLAARGLGLLREEGRRNERAVVAPARRPMPRRSPGCRRSRAGSGSRSSGPSTTPGPATSAARCRRPTSWRRCTSACCGSGPTSRTGRTATGSSCPRATRRSACTRRWRCAATSRSRSWRPSTPATRGSRATPT